jgi:hypothetical protein
MPYYLTLTLKLCCRDIRGPYFRIARHQETLKWKPDVSPLPVPETTLNVAETFRSPFQTNRLIHNSRPGTHDFCVFAVILFFLFSPQRAQSAIAVQGTLVTHNTKEFKRVSGLTIEDWY